MRTDKGENDEETVRNCAAAARCRILRKSKHDCSCKNRKDSEARQNRCEKENGG